MDHARGGERAHQFEVRADGEVGEAVGVEIADRQLRAELIVDLGGVQDAGHVLMPELVADVRKAGGRAQQHVDHTRPRDRADGVERGADGQVGEAVAVEVGGGERGAELVGGLGDLLDAGAVLVPQLVAEVGEAGGRARQHVDRTRTRDRADRVEIGADGQIVEAVGVEVAGGLGLAEQVAHFGGVQDAWTVLVPELVPDRGEPGCGAREHVDHTRSVHGTQVLLGRSRWRGRRNHRC